MDTLHVAIAGTHEVELQFETFPDALREALRAEIDGLADDLAALVASAAPKRTGRLASEVRKRVFDDPDHIKGEVDIAGGGAEAAKAGALEYGAHRSTKVAAHAMRLDHLWARRLDAPMQLMVAAYTRTPDIAETAFERGALAALAPEAIARLEAVVAREAERANGA